MSPSPQELGAAPQTADVAPPAGGDRVVISGMAGLFPRCRSVKDLENILYNKVNPVSADHVRWSFNHPEVVQCQGIIPGLNRFDAQFFRVTARQGNQMDPMSSKLLEQTYGALYDAGINPQQLNGKKVGVFVGTSISESEQNCMYSDIGKTGLSLTGCSKTMFANRISYWLNAKGPSMTIDVACCSSMAALEQAYDSMMHGVCEAAIVGGAYVCLHPQSAIHFGRVVTLAADGKTRSFDQNAAGTALSETVNVLILQKAKDALRIYADILHVKCEFTGNINTDNDIQLKGFYRNQNANVNFLSDFYAEAGVRPGLVEYIEAFGAADPEADKTELETMDELFCKDKKEPLLVGSVMSNIGYNVAATGVSAVTKVLLGYHKGELAANLHYETPRSDVACLSEGRIRILNEHQRFRQTYVAVNNMSVTGINGHVLLHGYFKSKDIHRYKTDIPRLVNISGRQESAVTKIFEELKSHPIDPEQLVLLHNIHETKVNGHLSRGFIVLDIDNEQSTISLSAKADYYDDSQRPLWFVYSGMGSQWAGMGAQLMRIPIFAAAIERCRRTLEPKGIDIVQIITSPDKSTFDNILHSFVGIAAMQIGLTDVLNELGLVPDKIIGHSVGELGCAYADGCLTAEEMILSAYSRGLVSLETPFIRGSMAAVGVGFEQMSQMCPPEIEIACHNSAESCTISGPAEAMRSLVADLTAKGIFAKEVPCSNIAYHSRYIAGAGPVLLKYLKEVIKAPRARSERWVSTSVPQDCWDKATAKYSSAEYHTNNLLSPVLFEESSRLIPPTAVLVEVAPHGLLQAILKRSLPQSCTNIPLTRRGHPDNVLMLLEAVGRLFIMGFHPKVRVLYPIVHFPVSTGTPLLSHFVEWMHDEEWKLSMHSFEAKKKAGVCEHLISVHDDEHKYLKGHILREKRLLPLSFALVAAWDTLSMSMNKRKVNVAFRDVQLYSQPILYDHRSTKLSVSLHKGIGRFEIMYENYLVATGYIQHSEIMDKGKFVHNEQELSEEPFELQTEDVYQLLREREYSYNGEFCSIESCNTTLTKANIIWNDNWVTLIDGIIQLNVLQHHYNYVSQPDRIGSITINALEHLNSIENRIDDIKTIKASVDKVQNFTRCGGIVIERMQFNYLPAAAEDHVSLKSFRFISRFHTDVDVFSAIQVIMQIVAENMGKKYINVIGLTDQCAETGIFRNIKVMAEENNIPGITIKYEQMDRNVKPKFEDVDLVVVRNLSNDDDISQILYSTLQSNTFIINEESLDDNIFRTRPAALYDVVSILNCKAQNARLELTRWRPSPMTSIAGISSTMYTIRSESDLPLLITTRNRLASQDSLVILSSYPPVEGLEDMVKKWRTDTTRNRVFLIIADRVESLEQLPNVNLAFNVIHEGVLGGKYYLNIKENPAEKYNVMLRCETVGDFNSLQWVQAPEPMRNGVLVKVHYAGLNVNDVKRAAGVIPNKNRELNRGDGFGMEFSGLTESGERVMGLVQHDAVSSHVTAQPELLWPVPPHWTLEDAATVPFAYVYAYYCLQIKIAGSLVEKPVTQFSVLVHGGAGALGQAMISIALAKGYRVFATVSDQQKKRFLLKLFPELQADDIGNSRDTSFGDMVMNATNGKGCNIVLCCLKGELKHISLYCCGSSGSTLDTVLINNKENYQLGMHYLTNERSYRPVDICSIFSHKMELDENMTIQTMLSEGIALGHVRPLSRVTFAPLEAPRAFRLLAASRHRGRVLLRMGDTPPHALPRFGCAQERCHLILCDNQNLGLQLADKLINRGADIIHLHIGRLPAHLRCRLDRWATLGVQVSVSSEDLKSADDIVSLLLKASNLGPLDGVYVISENSSTNKKISELDQITRKLCPSLKNFVVLSNDGKSGEYTCTLRARDGLPATMLDLSMLIAFYNSDPSLWHRKAIEATVLALRSAAEPVLLAQPQPSPQSSLLQQIAALADVNITGETSSNTTLKDLGMDQEKSQAISNFLRNKYLISLCDENVMSLTTEQIKQIEDGFSIKYYKEVIGLGTFYSYVDPDELSATTEIVFLPTLTTSSNITVDEFDVNDTFLCIVPGLEGHHARFRALCERLKLPAFVLQPGLDHPDETLQQLANRYFKVLLKRTGLKKSFYILGYETGVVVSLELAAILEEHGLTGTVFCLGDGPLEVQALLEAEARAFGSEAALQEGVARHMFALMARGTAAPAESLRGGSSWRARVDACVRTLLGHVSHSAQYARALVEAAYARIGTARRYNAAPRALRSRLVLLRARRVPDSGEECSLQRYSRRALVVADLAAPMAHAAADLQVPAVINRHLDDEILQAFQNKNLCVSY